LLPILPLEPPVEQHYAAIRTYLEKVYGVAISGFINANDKEPLFSNPLKTDMLNIVNSFKDRGSNL